jgi:hypothetical protein
VSFLLDTNVLSELVRRSPHPHVTSWVGRLAQATISVVTVEELFFGLAKKPNGRVQRRIDGFLESRCNVLDVTSPIARHAGMLRGQFAARGRIRRQADMLIAATCAVSGLTLATRNTRDFEDCGIALFDPFDPGPE